MNLKILSRQQSQAVLFIVIKEDKTINLHSLATETKMVHIEKGMQQLFRIRNEEAQRRKSRILFLEKKGMILTARVPCSRVWNVSEEM